MSTFENTEIRLSSQLIFESTVTMLSIFSLEAVLLITFSLKNQSLKIVTSCKTLRSLHGRGRTLLKSTAFTLALDFTHLGDWLRERKDQVNENHMQRDHNSSVAQDRLKLVASSFSSWFHFHYILVHGPEQVVGTTQGEKMWVISDERLYEGLFKFIW